MEQDKGSASGDGHAVREWSAPAYAPEFDRAIRPSSDVRLAPCMGVLVREQDIDDGRKPPATAVAKNEAAGIRGDKPDCQSGHDLDVAATESTARKGNQRSSTKRAIAVPAERARAEAAPENSG